MKSIKTLSILHLDGTAGLTMGLLMFFLQDWIGKLYNLPVSLIHFFAIANVCYGSYALSLAFSDNRKPISISILAIANALWMVVCVIVILLFAHTASLLGLLFVGLEGGFVVLLAIYEWQNRYQLSKVRRA
ncbi:hypothetical protein [Pseudoalteromonas rubra]|uniref:hypothetical protein n=1 Tax=Pseudoalteromonas rubra TaxID=43658 RepID=UPI000F77BEE0|nr:hypothetical protein [Pseudoalteromonas rubra]